MQSNPSLDPANVWLSFSKTEMLARLHLFLALMLFCIRHFAPQKQHY